MFLKSQRDTAAHVTTMDFYLAELENYVNPAYTLCELESSSVATSVVGCIIYDVDAVSSCTSLIELERNLGKRLTRHKGRASSVSLNIVAVLCLCTRDYTVNDTSIRGVTFTDMCKIWEVLETTKTSSSASLREWMTMRMGKRSYNGYIQSTRPYAIPSMFRSSAGPILEVPSGTPRVANRVVMEKMFGTACTLREAMICDSKLMEAVMIVNDAGSIDLSRLHSKSSDLSFDEGN